MNTPSQISDGGNSTIELLTLVDVPLSSGQTVVGIVTKVYAENHCMVSYTDECNESCTRMMYVDDGQ